MDLKQSGKNYLRLEKIHDENDDIRKIFNIKIIKIVFLSSSGIRTHPEFIIYE